MGYLSCRAESSVATCRSISSISPIPQKKSATNNNNDDNGSKIEHFDYTELEAATSHFAESALLGRGSHGAVYKAVLTNGRAVAVKRPSRRPSASANTPAARRDEGENEIEILSTLRGPRLVNLLGFSNTNLCERLLVFEYMPNGTIYELLHKNTRPPGWARRMRLALQTAKALRALHAAEPPVIHRDVKSANILLDANLDARLGDFGLALRADVCSGTKTTARATPPPAGTLGYLDPAYVTPESLSTKTDVFSFGILLLEIMSGRKAIDVAHSPPSVVEWAVPLLRKGKVAALFDPRVAPPRDPVARRQLASLAASCVRPCREKRPSMADIVEQLKVLSRTVSSKAWNGLVVVGNPCAVVDVERTISKLDVYANGAAADADADSGIDHSSSSVLRFEEDEEADAAAADTAEGEVSTVNVKKPPRPLRNTKVFSEASTKERRNLLELMARIDGAGAARFGIGMAKNVSASHEHTANAVFLLRSRHQPVKEVRSEKVLKPDCSNSLDGKIKVQSSKDL